MNIKSMAFQLIGHCCKMLSNFIPNFKATQNALTAEFPFKGLYEEKPLWKNIPPLRPSTLDMSIIVPVYNSERFLPKCLDSIVNQKTKYKFEVICINDGSKDSSQDILNAYKTKYPNIIVISQTNQGISRTRNRGIAEASGKYIGFVDNDDYLNEHYIETILDKAYSTDADMIQVGHLRVNPEGTVLAPIHLKSDTSILSGDVDARINYVSGYIWGGAQKKEIYAQIRFPEGYWYEDMITRVLLMRVAKRIECISECLYYYVVHNTNASKTVWKEKGYKFLDQFYLAKSLAEYGNQTFGLTNDQTLYRTLLYELGTVLWLRTRHLKIKDCRKIFKIAAQYMVSIRPVTIHCKSQLERVYDKTFLNCNFAQWYMFSLGHMCYIKARNES